jgi:hypothetical protein
MNAVVQFLPSGGIYFAVHSTAVSVDMCCCVMLMAGLMNGDLETFGMKLP